MQSGLCNCKPKFSLPGPPRPGASKAQPPRGLVGHCTSGRPLNPPLGVWKKREGTDNFRTNIASTPLTIVSKLAERAEHHQVNKSGSVIWFISLYKYTVQEYIDLTAKTHGVLPSLSRVSMQCTQSEILFYQYCPSVRLSAQCRYCV